MWQNERCFFLGECQEEFRNQIVFGKESSKYSLLCLEQQDIGT